MPKRTHPRQGCDDVLADGTRAVASREDGTNAAAIAATRNAMPGDATIPTTAPRAAKNGGTGGMGGGNTGGARPAKRLRLGAIAVQPIPATPRQTATPPTAPTKRRKEADACQSVADMSTMAAAHLQPACAPVVAHVAEARTDHNRGRAATSQSGEDAQTRRCGPPADLHTLPALQQHRQSGGGAARKHGIHAPGAAAAPPAAARSAMAPPTPTFAAHASARTGKDAFGATAPTAREASASTSCVATSSSSSSSSSSVLVACAPTPPASCPSASPPSAVCTATATMPACGVGLSSAAPSRATTTTSPTAPTGSAAPRAAAVARSGAPQPSSGRAGSSSSSSSSAAAANHLKPLGVRKALFLNSVYGDATSPRDTEVLCSSLQYYISREGDVFYSHPLGDGCVVDVCAERSADPSRVPIYRGALSLKPAGACLHCHRQPDGVHWRCRIPTVRSYDAVWGLYAVWGNFCCFPCVLRYEMEFNPSEAPYICMMVQQMAAQVFGITEMQRPAPPRIAFKDFCGPVDPLDVAAVARREHTIVHTNCFVSYAMMVECQRWHDYRAPPPHDSSIGGARATAEACCASSASRASAPPLGPPHDDDDDDAARVAGEEECADATAAPSRVSAGGSGAGTPNVDARPDKETGAHTAVEPAPGAGGGGGGGGVAYEACDEPARAHAWHARGLPAPKPQMQGRVMYVSPAAAAASPMSAAPTPAAHAATPQRVALPCDASAPGASASGSGSTAPAASTAHNWMALGLGSMVQPPPKPVRGCAAGMEDDAGEGDTGGALFDEFMRQRTGGAPTAAAPAENNATTAAARAPSHPRRPAGASPSARALASGADTGPRALARPSPPIPTMSCSSSLIHSVVGTSHPRTDAAMVSATTSSLTTAGATAATTCNNHGNSSDSSRGATPDAPRHDHGGLGPNGAHADTARARVAVERSDSDAVATPPPACVVHPVAAHASHVPNGGASSGVASSTGTDRRKARSSLLAFLKPPCT